MANDHLTIIEESLSEAKREIDILKQVKAAEIKK